MDKQRENENTTTNSVSNEQGSGTQYHNEHAGHIEGYGEIDPNAEQVRNSTSETSN